MTLRPAATAAAPSRCGPCRRQAAYGDAVRVLQQAAARQAATGGPLHYPYSPYATRYYPGPKA